MKKIRLILGDQLNHSHSWYQKVDPDTVYVMMEIRSETDYVRHHIQKIIAFFLSMRNFAAALEKTGHQVRYFRLDDPDNQQSFAANLEVISKEQGINHLEYQLPDEYRLDQELQKIAREQFDSYTVADTEHFLTRREEVGAFFQGKKQFLMESFYRSMRRKYGWLMEPNGKDPLQGKWNFDASNRKKLPPTVEIPEAPTFGKEVGAYVRLLDQQGVETMGEVDPDNFQWPTSRKEALLVLEHFTRKLLPHFGDYQDALTDRDPFLFHSRLSFVLNVKLLSPKEVVDHTIAYWQDHQEEISISQIEGFVRQIIGWREYMRGIYWAQMPEYASLNFLDHQGALPAFFWTGKTKMACMKQAIRQSLETSYAHHIQRLMVTGNFALLAGVHPDEVDQWYLGIYLDALEWVQITNTRGMSQFADGGIVGTKPYVSSANYIHKMGDHCKGCYYDHKAKTGEKACPFNSLYWHFYDRHREKLEKNPRIGMIYRTWDRMDPEKKAALLQQAEEYLEGIEEL
jgi:deoxyribodipyrimidine photolyase-related protein